MTFVSRDELVARGRVTPIDVVIRGNVIERTGVVVREDTRSREASQGQPQDGPSQRPTRTTGALRVAQGLDEHSQQVKLFEWAEGATAQHPELALLFAVPNWIGPRTARHGAYLKAEGKKAGVPDIVLPVPRGGYGALYIELKAENGKASQAQREWLSALNLAGNMTALCIGWEAARDGILDYLALG